MATHMSSTYIENAQFIFLLLKLMQCTRFDIFYYPQDSLLVGKLTLELIVFHKLSQTKR